MNENICRSNIGGVAEDVDKCLLIDGSDVQTKVGHVAKFDPNENKNDLEENVLLKDLLYLKKCEEKSEFIGLTKEVFHLFIY